MSEIVTDFGTFTEDQWGKIVDSGVAAGYPWGVPNPDTIGSLGSSGSDVDWGSVIKTGLGTAGDVIKTAAKDNREQAPSPQPTKPGTTPPQINVTLPPAVQPAGGTTGSNTPIVVGAILGGSALLGLAIWAAGRKRRS